MLVFVAFGLIQQRPRGHEPRQPRLHETGTLSFFHNLIAAQLKPSAVAWQGSFQAGLPEDVSPIARRSATHSTCCVWGNMSNGTTRANS